MHIVFLQFSKNFWSRKRTQTRSGGCSKPAICGWKRFVGANNARKVIPSCKEGKQDLNREKAYYSLWGLTAKPCQIAFWTLDISCIPTWTSNKALWQTIRGLKGAILLDTLKRKLCYSRTKRGSCVKYFKRLFQSSHDCTIGHARGAFRWGNTITTVEIVLTV